MQQFDHILYHAGCDDGFGAAWAAWKVYGDSIDYHACQYGTESPKLPAGSRVAILDFSFPRKTLISLFAMWGTSIVLDHHRTAEADLAGLEECTFDMDRSGAMMAWNFWHPNEPAPALINYVQDRDLWRRELPDSREFTEMLRSYPRDFKTWSWIDEDLLKNGLDYAIRDGHAILRRIDIQVEQAINNAVIQNVAGYRVPAVNETHNSSEVAGGLADKFKDSALFGAAYFIRGDGRRVWSLRSRGDFDVSDVAKQLGGGGHKNAAGFTEPVA